MVKTTSTNMTVVVSPDSSFIARPTPLTVTLPNPISITITNAGKEPPSCQGDEHKDSCCQAVTTNCALPHCRAGCKPTAESDTKLTPSNLLALLALLVALSAYLGSVRRELISKIKLKLADSEKIVAHIKATLELAELKFASTPDPAKIRDQEIEVAKREAVMEKSKLREPTEVKKRRNELKFIGAVDIVFIIAAFVLGVKVLGQAILARCTPLHVRVILVFVLVGGTLLLWGHWKQALKSFDDK